LIWSVVKKHSEGSRSAHNHAVGSARGVIVCLSQGIEEFTSKECGRDLIGASGHSILLRKSWASASLYRHTQGAGAAAAPQGPLVQGGHSRAPLLIVFPRPRPGQDMSSPIALTLTVLPQCT
jgi:hypothetical protein